MTFMFGEEEGDFSVLVYSAYFLFILSICVFWGWRKIFVSVYSAGFLFYFIFYQYLCISGGRD